jgi:hypothetical protein
MKSRCNINTSVLKQLEKALGIICPAGISSENIESLDSFVQILPFCVPAVGCIVIEKFRTTYSSSIGRDEVLVELAEIKSVKIGDQQQTYTFSSIGIEGKDLVDVRKVHDALEVPNNLHIKGYVQLIEDLVQENIPPRL